MNETSLLRVPFQLHCENDCAQCEQWTPIHPLQHQLQAENLHRQIVDKC